MTEDDRCAFCGGDPSVCGCHRLAGGHSSVKSMQERAALSQGTRLDEWKQAIDDELVTIGSTADSFPNAKAALKDLIDWNVTVALDPAVSSAAQALIDQGKRQAEPVALSTLTDEQIEAAVRPLYSSDEAASSGLPDDILTVRTVIAASAPALQAGQGEPAAWQERQFGFEGWSSWYDCTANKLTAGKREAFERTTSGIRYQFRPLYSHERAAPAPEPETQSEVALVERAVLRVGMKSLMNHGAASCVYTEGCNGVSQEHLIAFTREVALHCAVALATPSHAVAAEGVTDTQRLDWLDATNKRFRMGWAVGVAPAGNCSVQSIIMGGKPIREAIDAAISTQESGK